MNASFAGKKLLVVGGTSGMGFETAKRVLKNGGSVVLVGNRKDKAEQARQALAVDGPVSIIVADLMKEEGMQHVMNTINAEHKDISLLVNAAGVFFPKPFTEHEASDYDMYMSINRATFFITRDVVRNMVDAGIKGSIVNIGSMWHSRPSGPRRLPHIPWRKPACMRGPKTWLLSWAGKAFASMPCLRPLFTRQFMKASSRKTM